jgi:hypothetical protein
VKCPACGHEFANPTAQAGGRAGGAAKVSKGFASANVQRKALATRRRNARAKRSPNAAHDGRQGAKP